MAGNEKVGFTLPEVWSVLNKCSLQYRLIIPSTSSLIFKSVNVEKKICDCGTRNCYLQGVKLDPMKGLVYIPFALTLLIPVELFLKQIQSLLYFPISEITFGFRDPPGSLLRC